MTLDFRIDVPAVIDRSGYPNLEYVTWESARPLKEHLAIFAGYFKREMRFDTLQFDEDMFRDRDYVGVLFLQRAPDLMKHEGEHPCRVVGGGVFAEHDGKYELDWVWLHPFVRNRKLLGGSWKEFKQKFGKFSVAQPLSAQMGAFLKKHPVGP